MKLLVITSCMVRLGTEGLEPAEQGALINVDKGQADTLTKFGRALYTNKTDDPTKEKSLTASAEMVAAAEKLAAKKAKGTKEGTGDAGGTDLVTGAQ
jgi:hypothetical protein